VTSIERDGETISYDRIGDDSNAVVFAHNLLADRSVFEPVLQRISGRSIFNVDLRGHGQSTAENPFTIFDLAEDLAAILDRHEVHRATIVGVSLGASTAIEFALNHPDRVRGLVLMSPCGDAPEPIDVIKNSMLACALRSFGVMGTLIKLIAGSLFGSTFRKTHPDDVNAWAKKLAAHDPRPLAQAIETWTTRDAWLHRLGAIDVPTLVVVGGEDTAHPPAMGEKVSRAIRGAMLTSLDHVGHTIPLEDPATIATILESFFDRVEASGK
jgi:3-oxoadipate enol-lactonase